MGFENNGRPLQLAPDNKERKFSIHYIGVFFCFSPQCVDIVIHTPFANCLLYIIERIKNAMCTRIFEVKIK